MIKYAIITIARIQPYQWVKLLVLFLMFTGFQRLYRRGIRKKVTEKMVTKDLISKLCLPFSFALIVWVTLFVRAPWTEHQANLIILWSWYSGFIQSDNEIRWQIYCNILLFAPLGFCYYLDKHRPLWRIMLIGLIISLLVEICQYIFCLGLFEWDDMLHNSLGCLLGGYAGKTIERVWNIHRLHKTIGRE